MEEEKEEEKEEELKKLFPGLNAPKVKTRMKKRGSHDGEMCNML